MTAFFDLGVIAGRLYDCRDPFARVTPLRTALYRGWRKRCPHCGQGALFARWAHHLDKCSSCGLVYERNPGDTWFFTVFGDRVPIAGLVVVIYFGVAQSHHILGVLLFIALGAILIWTAPNRWGLGIALHYLSRVHWASPDDPIPERASSRD